MSTFCAAFPDREDALTAVRALLDRGVPGEDVRMLHGRPRREAGEAAQPGFAGPHEAEPHGAFAGRAPEQAPAGSYAGRAGERNRLGSFGDVDRDYEESFPGGVEDVSRVDHNRLVELVTAAGLDEAIAQRDVEALHEGSVLVLTAVDDAADEDVRAILERG